MDFYLVISTLKNKIKIKIKTSSFDELSSLPDSKLMQENIYSGNILEINPAIKLPAPKAKQYKCKSKFNGEHLLKNKINKNK